MEKAWWRLFFSKQNIKASTHLPGKGDTGANVLRQTAIQEFKDQELVTEYVYFGANEKKEMGFHRTLIFSHFLYELVNEVSNHL